MGGSYTVLVSHRNLRNIRSMRFLAPADPASGEAVGISAHVSKSNVSIDSEYSQHSCTARQRLNPFVFVHDIC